MTGLVVVAPPVCGCSSLPVKDPLEYSSSPVYQAVQCAEKDLETWTRVSNVKSKSFKVLAHMTGTESVPEDEDEEALRSSR